MHPLSTDRAIWIYAFILNFLKKKEEKILALGSIQSEDFLSG